ncbi:MULTISPECIES: hypothetical protein [Bacillus cereus group]|uniref:hypothetical protein n=1 Tax=Bacillus cereus group TaxID=86661 RepID=UPI0021583C63|nr:MULTISPECIES: hypothetical protein [Bacillus cereus group]MCR6795686.1 hypothetical protein [Bacillus paranthracis]MDX5886257.1 hypothetical protein [Bacillus cereus group sp. BfR-BA-00999]MED1166009.1 hypothetical protein [Bacillus paranthracis]
MEKFSFFNSVNGDRRYKAEDWANYFNKFITNGYFPNIASNLQVIASGTNMKVTLRAGAAWINGYMYQNTTDFDLTIQTADAVNSRKDRVVLRLDHEKRDIRAYVKKGTPSSSPVAPALQRDADAYELSVAEVYVRNGVVVITQEAVTDVRLNKDLCGVVNSLLQADTTAIFNQYWDWFVRTKQKYEEDNSVIMSDFRKLMEDEKKRYNTEFTAWFQNLKNVLDTNTAGNLLNEINKINDKWNATLVELDKKSQALQHGLNVVNAPVDSPLNIEIQGRTLANVLGKDGAVPQTNKVFSVETAKYYLIINSSGTQVTVDSTAQNTPYKFTGKASVSLTWTVGMVALYEVDQATYNKINVDPEYSGQKLMDKFPYVEGVQHLNPVVVVESGNLIPPFTEWTLHANAKVVNPYELELNATATNQHTFISIDCSPNTQYTLDVLTSGFYIIDCLDSLNGITSTPAFLKNGKITFTTPINTKRIQIKFTNGNVATGKFTFSNIMLVVGDKPKPFAPRNPSYLYANTSLAGQNGVNDVLYQEDGQWKVLRKWERDVALDGAKNWVFQGNKTGLKSARVTGNFGISIQPPYGTRVIANKWNNTVVPAGNLETDLKEIWDLTSSDIFNINIMNSDTGFTDSYLPISDEVKAYFNGWKVKTADGTGKPTAWVSVVDGKDAPTQTIAYVRANRAPNYTPYKLTYQLATPRVEVVQVEGELVTSGITQVNADNGVVVREKVVPNTFQGTAYINSTSSKLKARVNKILGVYKNGQLDSGWELMYRNGGESDYPLLGKGFARINTTILDPTAEYTVTYLVQDKHLFTTNVIDVKVTYNQSLASTVREVVEKQADNSTLLFAQQAKVSELTAKTREYGLRLTPRRSGKDENDIFTVTEYKMANGMVRKRSVLSNPNAYGSYLTRTETEYLENGAVQKVTLLDLIYDADGNFIDEVERT